MTEPTDVTTPITSPMHALDEAELQLINDLRNIRPSSCLPDDLAAATRGERAADAVTSLVGSWAFLIVQSTLLLSWIAGNAGLLPKAWDPYPFILLNLMLSFQAAYTAPVILMSQNRETRAEKRKLDYYYRINLKQELEIELLHAKIDLLIAKHNVGDRS